MTTFDFEKAGPLWAITSYYNPCGYWRRRHNYRAFREHLGVPLLTVELSFDGRYELERGDAEVMVRLSGGAILWQKERLLNVALAHLPLDCTAVAIVDCDVIFPHEDWTFKLLAQLQKSPLVQPFTQVVHWPADFVPSWDQQADIKARTSHSVASLIGRGTCAAECLGKSGEFQSRSRAPGFAWAARRELLAEHGLYDACITGGGDLAMAAAAYGLADALVHWQSMNPSQASHYLPWAHRFARDVGGDVGFLEGDLWHLWHGERKDRRFQHRYRDLQPFEFDPDEDVVHSPGRPWRWNSDKLALHEHLRDYYVARQEDGVGPEQRAA
jgi:hypothetical protein